MTDATSVFTLYSVGLVAVNKALGSNEIEVTPLEKLPMTDGEVTDNASTSTVKAADKEGEAYQAESVTTLTVKASWLPLSATNRVTAPDVRRGEMVRLYQMANDGDSGVYYWCTLKEESGLRRLETVRYAYSGTVDESVKVLTRDNSYYLEFSTHNQTVSLHTSKANGEPYAYDVQINAKEGRVLITDDVGNYWMLDSKNTNIRAENIDGTWLELNQKSLNAFAPESINLEAGQAISLKAGATINTETKTHTEMADTITHDAPQIVEKGNLFTEAGRGGSTGAGRLRGDFFLEGSMEAEKDLTAQGRIKGTIVESVQDFVGPNV